MLHFIYSTVHLIDTIANIFLLTFGVIALPSVLLGGISLAADRHRQGQQALAHQDQEQSKPIETPAPTRETVQAATPQQTLRPAISDAEAQTFSTIDPLATAESQAEAQSKTPVTSKPKVQPKTAKAGSTGKSNLSKLLIEQYGRN